MSIRIGNVGIDTTDLAGASAFWQAVTHYEVSSSGDDHTYLVDPAKEGPGLFVQLVPEPRVGKNRLHLDLFTDDLDGEVATRPGPGRQRGEAVPRRRRRLGGPGRHRRQPVLHRRGLTRRTVVAPQGFTLFETAIGHCGVAWSPRGLVGVQLPEGRPAATRARMRRRWAEADERTAAQGGAGRGRLDGVVARGPARRPVGRRARHGRRAQLPPARLRGGPHHPGRADPDLR